jgi:hypothetical protein
LTAHLFFDFTHQLQELGLELNLWDFEFYELDAFFKNPAEPEFKSYTCIKIKEPFHEEPEDDAHRADVAFQTDDDDGLAIGVGVLDELEHILEYFVVETLHKKNTKYPISHCKVKYLIPMCSQFFNRCLHVFITLLTLFCTMNSRFF